MCVCYVSEETLDGLMREEEKAPPSMDGKEKEWESPLWYQCARVLSPLAQNQGRDR